MTTKPAFFLSWIFVRVCGRSGAEQPLRSALGMYTSREQIKPQLGQDCVDPAQLGLVLYLVCGLKNSLLLFLKVSNPYRLPGLLLRLEL